MVLVTVRVLPFLVLTVVLICFVTLLTSTLGVRSYSAQRYPSMQVSTTRHSSTISSGRAAGRRSSPAGASGLNRDTSRSWVSDGGVEPCSGRMVLDDGSLGGGGAREAEGRFARVRTDRRRIGGRRGRVRNGWCRQLEMERGGSGHCGWQPSRSPGCPRAVPDRRCGMFDVGPLEAAEPRSRPTGQHDHCAQQHQRKLPRSRHRSPPPVRLP